MIRKSEKLKKFLWIIKPYRSFRKLFQFLMNQYNLNQNKIIQKNKRIIKIKIN